MKQNIYSILLTGAVTLSLTGCDKEAAFNMNPGEGQLNCEALSVDYINRGKTRADVQVGDFIVNFVNTSTNEVARSFKYSQMPEIVALPVGNYRAEAVYGDNPIAEWEAPYYTGYTSFGIQEGKITDNIDPVECILSNIKITVHVDDLGLGILDDDVKVIVSAGEEGELVFNSSTNDKAGYFRYVDGSQTITAQFTGTVDGVLVDQTVAYDDAAEGNAYNLNFEINRPDNVNPGSIVISESGMTLDATITISDETHPVDPNEPDDEILTDTMRPSYPDKPGDEPGSGDEPGNDPGNNPNDDPIPANGPSIIPLSPGLILNQCCVVSECEFKVVSESDSGITEFSIRIESPVLTPDELGSIGLTDEFDLINPGTYEAPLSGLGFKVGDEVKGKKECTFSITSFLGMIPGAGEHKFHLTVTDDNGTTTGFIGITTEE